jgi:hypothetical protein
MAVVTFILLALECSQHILQLTRDLHHPDYHTTLVNILTLLTYYTYGLAPLSHVSQ